MVAAAVAGKEGDPSPGDLAEEQGVARRPVGGIDLYLGHIVEEGVEARATDDTDLCVRHDKHSSWLRRTASENAGDPAVVRRRGPRGKVLCGRAAAGPLFGFYAAELLLDEPLPDDFALDDFESDEDDEVVDDEDDVEGVDGLVAGELLDEEPRLSLR
jgi:hypothetical protein